MRVKQFITVGLMVLTSGSLVVGFSSGPPDGVTNAPGEANCTDCHFGNVLNTPGGTLTLTLSDTSYTPGETLSVVINLARAGQSRWGFEITALSGGNVRIGTILDTSTFTQLTTGFSGRQYLKHTTTGTFALTPNASPGWGFKWVPPVTDSGPVTFYVAGNAANNSGTSIGDFIYATSASLPYEAPGPPPVCCFGTVGNVDCDPGDGVDIGDLTALVNHLFVTFAPLCCFKEADVDISGGVDIADLSMMVDYLFITFTPLQTCP